MDKFNSDSSGCYHLSIRTTTNEFELIKQVLSSHPVELVFFIVTQEFGSVEKNLHFHYHLTLRSPIKLESIMSYLRSRS